MQRHGGSRSGICHTDTCANYLMAPSTWRTKNRRGRVLGEEVRSRCRNDRDAESPQHVMASELHGQVAGEPIGRLYDDKDFQGFLPVVVSKMGTSKVQ